MSNSLLEMAAFYTRGGLTVTNKMSYFVEIKRLNLHYNERATTSSLLTGRGSFVLRCVDGVDVDSVILCCMGYQPNGVRLIPPR